MKSFLLAVLAVSAAAAPTTIGSEKAQGITRRAPNKKGFLTGTGVNSPFHRDETEWGYDWGASLTSSINGYVPMYHCPGPGGNKDNILSLVSSRKTEYVLGYNECDHVEKDGGCACTPGAAAAAWGDDMGGVHQAGGKIVCPAISSFDTTVGKAGFESGLTWLAAFVGSSPTGKPDYFGCDAQAIHWYGEMGKSGTEQAKLFLNYLDDAHKRINGMFGREMPLWITEFAPLPPTDMVVMGDFLRNVTVEMDKLDYVQRYSPEGGIYHY